MSQNPTIGRIVIYKTTEEDRENMKNNPESNIQEELPAVVVAVWGPDMVNLKVITDGNEDLWVCSSERGSDERMWMFPERK